MQREQGAKQFHVRSKHTLRDDNNLPLINKQLLKSDILHSKSKK